MNPSNSAFLDYKGGLEEDLMSPKNDNSLDEIKNKLDGNGNMDEENDGVLLMVSCKNLLRNQQNNSSENNAQSTSSNVDETPKSRPSSSSNDENIKNNEDYEISTWSFSAENISDERVEDEINIISPGNRNNAKPNAFYCDGFTSPYRNRFETETEPIHMTLEEVKTSLQRLYGKETSKSKKVRSGGPFHQMRRKCRKQNVDEQRNSTQRRSFPSSLKQTLCGWFKKGCNSQNSVVHSKSSEELSSRRGVEVNVDDESTSNLLSTPSQSIPSLSPFANRALPPLPLKNSQEDNNNIVSPDCGSEECNLEGLGATDFTASIHKVKDYGWYWGPISGEVAEKLLSQEPDGSFIVRDSSDERYIFSLTFKLNGLVRHVRIEHDQGNFSFGTFTNFRSHTIVGFIENAVEHSRSGRYLFFLHRRPILGPMRVQLLHPVSRFKQVQSLQHMCRFIILKAVRRDLIASLPLPRRLKDYLNTPQYYTEEVENNVQSEVKIAPVATPEQHLLLGEIDDVGLMDSVR